MTCITHHPGSLISNAARNMIVRCKLLGHSRQKILRLTVLDLRTNNCFLCSTLPTPSPHLFFLSLSLSLTLSHTRTRARTHTHTHTLPNMLLHVCSQKTTLFQFPTLPPFRKICDSLLVIVVPLLSNKLTASRPITIQRADPSDE